MIEVTRLNGIRMILNSDLIKIAESSPDTMLTLIHGEKLIVRESCEEILSKVLEYRATLLAAVASRSQAASDLHRVVALSSVPPYGSGEASETERVEFERSWPDDEARARYSGSGPGVSGEARRD